VWHGIRTWMRSASNYTCLWREENPGGRTGYPENHWNSFFVSPKCGKKWVWPVSQIQVQGDWIWSRWQVSAPAVNWPLDPSELSGLFIKTPCEMLYWKSIVFTGRRRCQRIDQVKNIKIWDSTRIYNSGRILEATDKGIDNRAHYLSTPEAR
jgi:hypothetical protein